MECIHCNAEIESDDNFCWSCGHWTTRGYTYFKNNPDQVEKFMQGAVIKQQEKLGSFMSILCVSAVIFLILIGIQGKDMFKPLFYIEKQVYNFIYGYNTSLVKTDNQYNQVDVVDLNEALYLIDKDLNSESWQCNENIDVTFIEVEISRDHNIENVSLCDVSLEETTKIKNVIDRVYMLFPNSDGYLTNITITNAKTSSEYVAYFQPIYQFINSSENINNYNKVNKTQLLLNSYYFLNEQILNNEVKEVIGDGWYVNDASWESIVAHEFGHYISFVTLLKTYNIDNIVFETKENEELIQKILEIVNSGTYSNEIVNQALFNFNEKYQLNWDMEMFTLNISKYANAKNKDKNFIYDEVIAEAVHDYYLHEDNSQKSSLEIIYILKERLKI